MRNEKAIGFRIIVLPDQIAQETASGIKMYTDDEWEIAQRAVDVGVIVSIGNAAFKHDRFGNESPVKVGDKVRFKKYATHLFRDVNEHGRAIGEWYGVVNDDDILTVLGD